MEGSQAGTHAKSLAIHLPESLHEQLVLLGHGEVEGIVLCEVGPAAEAVEVEEDVVEDRQLVVDGRSAVANLLVQVVEALLALGRVCLGWRSTSGQTGALEGVAADAGDLRLVMPRAFRTRSMNRTPLKLFLKTSIS